MKPAREWLQEVGEACGSDMFSPDSGKPGHRTERLIKSIQKEALEEAIELSRAHQLQMYEIGSREAGVCRSIEWAIADRIKKL